MTKDQFLSLLKAAYEKGVSDIHLRARQVPAFRVRGELKNVKTAAFTDTDMADVAQILTQGSINTSKPFEFKEIDGSYEYQDLCRFRFNLFKSQGQLGAVLRIIPATIPTIDDLGLPSVLKSIALNQRGLVLVTGATGSGKSTTLATMIDHLNTHRAAHILTIEDPLEFIHPQKKARLTQREIGTDSTSFASALRAALRQDPDVILVGEMRDPETIDIALKAAETGHLVFSTVHTTDAIKTISRLISVFPSQEQHLVRQRLSENIMATISQRLIPKADKSGRVVVQEIMVATYAIRECIADLKRTGELNEYIEKSREVAGGQTFDQHLMDLLKARLITVETAKAASSNPLNFERNLVFGKDAIDHNEQEQTSSSLHKKSKRSGSGGRSGADGSGIAVDD
jgi:twitching motility protein PilT